ncbi:MAG: BatD family protein [Sedimentitalea sp.]|nr:BatD family protein [Sedimentitalea sp.]
MRRLLALAMLWLPAVAAAQQLEPLLRQEMDAAATIPGQAVQMRITLLVPTWMPEPPVFPGFEAPNVMTRLPEGAAGPTSETIDGETWSGVTRAYRLIPMQPGRFTIPPGEIVVTWADPETTAPRVTRMTTEAITVVGALPEGAEGLDPFIAAGALTLEQSLEGDPDTLEIGGAVTRQVTARIEGTSALVVPPLIPAGDQPGLAAYAKEPVVEETDDRGALSGQRRESVTYVPEAGGRFTLAPIRLDWFNLQTGRIETAELPAVDLAVAGAPAGSAPATDRRALLLRLGAAALGLAVLGLVVWRLRRPVAAWIAAVRARRHASEAYAYRRVRAALSRHDPPAVLAALPLWSARLPPADGPEEERLTAALGRLGAARYGQAPAPSGADWAEARAALAGARHARLAAQRAPQAVLPPLNPAPGRG